MNHILHNGNIYTQFKDKICVSALAILGEKVVAAGSDGDILSSFKNHAEIIDLEGRTVLPGFTDAHIHLSLYAQSLQRVDCETGTLQQCLDRIKEKVKSIPQDGWLLGHGWNQNTWSGQYGTKTMLDEVDAVHPIYLTAKSLHAGWANSKALQAANISRMSSDPEGGVIHRDQFGEPSGILFESAMALVEKVIPQISDTDHKHAIQLAQEQLNKFGFTGIHDFDSMDCFNALETLLAEKRLTLRAIKNIPYAFLEEVLKLAIHTGFGDPLLKFGAVKLFSDGALGPKTAAMIHPYEQTFDDYGMLLLEEEEILQIGKRAVAGRLPLTIHAIGDRANRVVINALLRIKQFEKVIGISPLRHRIEHLQLIAPSDLEILRGSGIVASMQPFHAISDHKMADRLWGKRSEFSYPWKSVQETGTPLAFGSDAPVESPDPFAAIHAAVTRLPDDFGDPRGWYPNQNIGLSDALHAYTYGAAYAANQELNVGKLLEGYFADLIVVEQDPFKTSIKQLPEMVTSATMVGGNWVWKGF